MKAMCIALSFLIASQQLALPPLYAQNAQPAVNIVVVSGEGAMNNIGQRGARDPIVRIEDENHKPVAEAAVVFTLPADGASGEFENGDKTLIVMTDNKGEAVARGLKVNQVAGKLQIHVTASYRGRTARTNITQFNMSVPGKRAGGSAKTALIILAIAGAAAAGGVTAATRKGSSTGAPPPASVTPISITPSPGVVGPPR
jgi:hypothetical protein